MVIQVIAEIINRRKEERRIPHCAPLRDVIESSGLSEREVLSEVEKLKKEGKIAIKQTINSQSFYLV